jgi:hypothetical protein
MFKPQMIQWERVEVWAAMTATLQVFNSPPGDALRPYSAAASSGNAGAREIQWEADRGDWIQGWWGRKRTTVRHRSLDNGDWQHAEITRRAVRCGGENAAAWRRVQRGNFGPTAG